MRSLFREALALAKVEIKYRHQAFVRRIPQAAAVVFECSTGQGRILQSSSLLPHAGLFGMSIVDTRTYVFIVTLKAFRRGESPVMVQFHSIHYYYS